MWPATVLLARLALAIDLRGQGLGAVLVAEEMALIVEATRTLAAADRVGPGADPLPASAHGEQDARGLIRMPDHPDQHRHRAVPDRSRVEITAGHDGNVWFTENDGKRIARVN
jgi:hypothetical protein